MWFTQTLYASNFKTFLNKKSSTIISSGGATFNAFTEIFILLLYEQLQILLKFGIHLMLIADLELWRNITEDFMITKKRFGSLDGIINLDLWMKYEPCVTYHLDVLYRIRVKK